MNILRMFTRTSPTGLILGGAALALTISPVRQGLRAASVLAIRGVLSISDEAKRFTNASRQSMQDIIEEVQADDCCPTCDEFAEDLRSQPRRLAIAATAGVLAVSDKAKEIMSGASREIKNMIEDARSSNEENMPIDPNDEHLLENHDGLEGEIPKH